MRRSLTQVKADADRFISGPLLAAIIQVMQTLRHAHVLARLVLVWFALALGVAIASPLVNPQSIELVCASGGAMKLIIKGDDGGQVTSSHTLDCPMCMTAAAPPPLATQLVQAPSTLVHALRPLAADHIASRSAAPLPPRGPPALS